MRGVVRALMLLLVLAFAAGTVTQAVQASQMMPGWGMPAMTAGHDGATADCDGCGVGKAGNEDCSSICMAPVVAVFGAGTAVPATVADDPPSRWGGWVAGRHGVPDPGPPRGRVPG